MIEVAEDDGGSHSGGVSTFLCNAFGLKRKLVMLTLAGAFICRLFVPCACFGLADQI